jgi:hypothetical protein
VEEDSSESSRADAFAPFEASFEYGAMSRLRFEPSSGNGGVTSRFYFHFRAFKR